MAGLTAEQSAFVERLVDEYYDRMYKYAMLLTGASEDAADMTQETFLTAAGKAAALTEHPNVYGWLRSTLYHHYQHWREKQTKELRYRYTPPEKEDTPDADIERLAVSQDDTGKLLLDMDMKRLLSPEDYLLVRRVYFESETSEEAARALGMTPAACRKRLQRIREKLRKKFPK